MSGIFTGPSVQERLTEVHGRPSGFDYMRLVLALSIIVVHSAETSYGPPGIQRIVDFWRAPVAILLPMFFSLSGFLVAGSLERAKTLISFLGLRVLRIVPALAGETLLSALLLGPLLTVLPLREYYTDPRFAAYFRNIYGDIHYTLPGMFLHNPMEGTVNTQLWTVPCELGCYYVLTLIAVFGLFKRRWLLLAVTSITFLMQFDPLMHWNHHRALVVTGETLVMSYVVGVIFYKFKEKIPWNFPLFLLAITSGLVLLSSQDWDRFSSISLTYVTVYLGLMNPRRNKIALSGDYSYGLFLYGYALQQAFVSIGPATRHWYLNVLVMIPVISLVAAASWWFIEKPFLELRVYLKAFEGWYLIKMEQRRARKKPAKGWFKR